MYKGYSIVNYTVIKAKLNSHFLPNTLRLTMTGKATCFSDRNSKTILEEDHKNIKVGINSLFY